MKEKNNNHSSPSIGWICPVCNTGQAPWSSFCSYCTPNYNIQVASSSTAITKNWPIDPSNNENGED